MQNPHPGYRQALGECTMNTQNAPNADKYYPNLYQSKPQNSLAQTSKINNAFMPPPDELDSRNEVFTKSGTDPSFKDKRPGGNLQVQVPKSNPPASMMNKSKNLHNKINRGISPNQPPQYKNKAYGDQEEKKQHQPPSIGKHPVKESIESAKRSSSLKIKKETENMAVYNKPSPSSRGGQRTGGGSFVVPSNTSSSKKNDSFTKNKSKTSHSSQNLKTSYSKPTSAGISSHINPETSGSGHYRLGSSYGVRQPGGSNFAANNPKIRKPTNTNAAAQNTMASFRSGPVKVVNDRTKPAPPPAPSTSSNPNPGT